MAWQKGKISYRVVFVKLKNPRPSKPVGARHIQFLEQGEGIWLFLCKWTEPWDCSVTDDDQTVSCRRCVKIMKGRSGGD